MAADEPANRASPKKGSFSRSPSACPASISPSAGAELVAVPGPASGDPGVRRLRVGVHDEVPVGALLVLAHPRLDQRGAAHRREAVLHVGPRGSNGLRGGSPVPVRGIERCAPRVVRHLETPVVAPGDAIEQARSRFHPDRQLGVGQVGASGRGAEVEDLLPRGAHEGRIEAGEEFREPRAAREDEEVRLERFPVRQPDVPHGPASGGSGGRLGLTVLAPLGQETLEHALAAAPREEVAGALLVERVGEAVGVDLGEAARELLAGEFFERDAEVAQDRDGVLRILVDAVAHPERPGLEKEPVAPTLSRLLPDLERPDHHLGIDAVGAVGGADDPGLSPRARPRIPRSPRVHEGHPGAPAEEFERRPAAEGPGAHHDGADSASCLGGACAPGGGFLRSARATYRRRRRRRRAPRWRRRPASPVAIASRREIRRFVMTRPS